MNNVCFVMQLVSKFFLKKFCQIMTIIYMYWNCQIFFFRVLFFLIKQKSQVSTLCGFLMKSWLNILGIEKHDKGSFWNMTVSTVYNKRSLLTICTLFSSSCGIEKEGRLLCPIGQAPAWKRSKVIPSLYHWHYVQRSIQKIWKNNLTNNKYIKSFKEQMF